MTKRFAGVAAGVLLGCWLVAAPDVEGAETAAEPPEKDGSLVCSYRASVGTHIRKKACVTREAEERRRKQDQEAAASLRGASSRSTSNREQGVGVR